MRKRPRKQQVKSPWQQEQNPTNHLRKSQRQQDRAADAITKSTQERSKEQPRAVRGDSGAQHAQPQTGLAPVRVPRRIVKVTAFAPRPCEVSSDLVGIVYVE